MSHFMGIGTTLYGEKDYNKDTHEYIATKWFIFFLFPIFPIASFRVKRLNTKLGFDGFLSVNSQYELTQIKKDSNQIFLTYLGTYGAIILFFLLVIYVPSFVEISGLVLFCIPFIFIIRSAIHRGSFS
jgi:hypothetical protein